MKKRTKEEMSAYKREWRKRKAATAPDQNVTPSASHPVTPSKSRASAVSVPCPDCAALSLEVKALLAKVALLQAQVKGKAPDDTSLYQFGVAEKVGRISTHSTGHTIGTVR
jgi:hypothetical protein